MRDKRVLADVVEVFLQEYPRQVAHLQEAMCRRDAHQLERAAHRFKATVGAVGASTASTPATELETLGRTAHLKGAATVLRQLDGEADRVVAFFGDPAWQECV
jgi:HPt (histidine-containing phosphotransfer) domain-containing protein